MAHKTDIRSRQDIDTFIRAFYDKVRTDDTIGFIFNDIVQMDWETHIPVIVDFWETILLDNPVYKKNAMEVHYALNKIAPLQPGHFQRWLLLFNKTLDELFEGNITMLAKTRAKAIAAVMELKMQAGNKSIM